MHPLTSCVFTGKLKAKAECAQASCDEARSIQKEKEKDAMSAINDKQRLKEVLEKVTHERDNALVRCNHLSKELEDQTNSLMSRDSRCCQLKETLGHMKKEIDDFKAAGLARSRELDKVTLITLVLV